MYTLTRCQIASQNIVLFRFESIKMVVKEYMSDSFTNYSCVGNTKVSVSIKKTSANKCTLSEIFLSKILKSFSVF